MQQPHIILHLSVLIFPHAFLVLLFHWFVVENNILDLFMIQAFILRITHHPLELLGVKVIPDQLLEFVGALGSQLFEN